MNNWQDQIQDKGIEQCGRFYSIYFGIVVDNKDPLSANRLLVRVPEVYGDTVVTRIALPMFGIMGKGYGTHFLPKTSATVIIMFKNGDADYPYWKPAPYADNERPTEFDNDEIFGFKSRTGHLVSIDDGNNTITIQHKDGYHFEIKEDKITIGNDVRIEIQDDGISLGKKSVSLQPAVLGNDLKQWLSDILTLVSAGLVDSTTGKVVPFNAPDVVKLTTDLEKILAKY